MLYRQKKERHADRSRGLFYTDNRTVKYNKSRTYEYASDNVGYPVNTRNQPSANHKYIEGVHYGHKTGAKYTFIHTAFELYYRCRHNAKDQQRGG